MRGPISSAVSGVIGLIVEARHRNTGETPSAEEKALQDGELHDDDRDDWILDEAQDSIRDQSTPSKPQDLATLIQQLPQRSPEYYTQLPKLPNPVILPQRRPRSKARGFIRAYAPDLQAYDLDPDLFMAFLDGFDAAVSKQSLFIAANMAVAAGAITSNVMFGNTLAIDVVAFAIHTTIEYGRRYYMAHNINHYLIDMNEQIFQPRGLYALIMTWKPDTADTVTEIINMDMSVAASVATEGKPANKLSVSTGVTPEWAMPQAATLVFPGFHGVPPQKARGAFQKAAAFASDYSDRRAQARFQAHFGESSLNLGSGPEFASKWSDPNHPMHTGGPLAILTGGKFSFDNEKRKKKERENLAAGKPKDQGTGGFLGGIQRKLQEEVIYLMITNMPSQAELQKAAELTARIEQERAAAAAGA